MMQNKWDFKEMICSELIYRWLITFWEFSKLGMDISLYFPDLGSSVREVSSFGVTIFISSLDYPSTPYFVLGQCFNRIKVKEAIVWLEGKRH